MGQNQAEADLLTNDEHQQLLARVAELLAVGYGELTIVARAGRLRFFRLTTSHPAGLTQNGERDTVPGESDS
jgi:hypothetical protein